MKFVIVLSCLFALALANYETDVVEQSADVGVESFRSSLKLGDGQFQEQSGHLAGEGLVEEGSFGWTSPEGVPVHITYTADENGYHPTGDVLPHN